MTSRRLAGLLLIAAAGVVGCDEKKNSREATPRRSAATTRTSPGTAVVRGKVTFKGIAPEAEEIPAARCHSGAAATTIAPVVVSDAGGLKDVMVYAKDVGPVDGEKTPEPVVLDQVNCQYVPHVLGLRTGQVLRVTSSDATIHNVHALCVDNPPVNFGMTAAGQSRDLTFAAAERFAVKCDVHPWMRAHVYVFDHPLFAATGDDGRYEIRGVPAGRHTLVFSHPFLGDRQRTADVAEGGAAEVDLTYERGGK